MKTTLTDHAGNWWIPENQDNVKQGILKFRDGSFTLELHDGLRLPCKDRIFKTIFGLTTTGYEVTLSGIYENGNSSYNFDINISYYLIEYVLFNSHLSENELIFNRYSLKISKVDKWVDHETLTEDTVFDDSGKSAIQFSITYDKPIPKEVNISKQGKLLWQKYLMITNSDNGARCLLQENIFEFDLSEEIDLKSFFTKWAFALSSYFSFLLSERVYPISIQAIDKNGKHIDIYSNYQKEQDELKNPDHFRIPFGLLKTYVLPMLSAWLNSFENMSTVYANFLIKDSFKPIPVEYHFLSLFQAFEGFSRASGRLALYMDQEAHKAVIEEIKKLIPENIDNDFKTSLNNRLKFSNEFSLRKRLSTEIKFHQEILDEIDIDWVRFLSKSVDARNYLTHDLKDQGLEEPSLRLLIEFSHELKCFLYVLIFSHLELDKKNILRLLRWYGYKMKKI